MQAAAVAQEADPGFSVTVQGAGSERVGTVDVDASFGSIDYGTSSHSIYVYERIPWPEFEYVLYQGLAVREESWLIVWFYCQEDQLKWVYHETTHGDNLAVEAATGTCQDGASQTVSVEMPETNMTPPLAQTTHTIQGDSIQYTGGQGWMLINDANWTFVPFQTIDCSTECGESGWHELHIVLWNETLQQAGFGILYLRSWSTNEITFEYGLMLPELERVNAAYAATWSS